MKVILLNPDLTYGTPPQMLQGLSGRTYAMSRWNAVYHCHAVEMSLEEFEKCWADIQRAVHLQLRRWFPRFVVPERPVAVVEFESGYQLGVDGKVLGETASLPARAGWKAARGEGVEEPQAVAAAPEEVAADDAKKVAARAHADRPCPQPSKGRRPSARTGARTKAASGKNDGSNPPASKA